MRAMILAAGLGTRLRPLTQVIPKPALPMLNRPMLTHHLTLLRDAGVTEVMINLHHLPDILEERLRAAPVEGISLYFSREPVILGTGGGLKQVAGFFAGRGEPFFLLNGDLMIDVSLQDVLETHRRSGAVATMCLREDPEAAAYGALGVDGEGRIIDFVGRARAPGTVVRSGLFTGIHVLEEDVLALLPEGESCINRTAYPALISGGARVQAHFQQGFWSDVGTPGRYFSTSMALLSGRLRLAGMGDPKQAAWALTEAGQHGSQDRLKGLDAAEVLPNVLLAEGVSLGAGARLGPSVAVGEGASIGAGARVRRSVIWPGASIEPDVGLDEVIAWFDGSRTHLLSMAGMT
jgi:NDP-sugar pyrophosphorylase family protein